jgi:prolyl-tRNA synthetase
MKDAYSFDQDEEGLDKNYRLMHEAYQRIFSRCGLKTLITEADSGVMGGKVSHEFMAPSPLGEDIVLSCPKCETAKAFKEEGALCPSCGKGMERINTTEVGHIFKLGIKYSQAMQANFSDHSGQLKPLIMGCYGIGVSRLVATIIEQNNDSDGIIWPAEVAPFDVVILPLDVNNRELMESAERLYRKLRDSGKEVLLDDRDERAGIKFKDADLTGIPLSIVVGKKGLEEKKVELRIRKDKSSRLIPEDVVLESVSGILF